MSCAFILGYYSRKYPKLSRENRMKRKTLLTTGIIGSLVVGVCCFTPVLVWLFVAVGLTALVVYLDYVLFPALAVFLGITAYAFLRKRDLSGQKNQI